HRCPGQSQQRLEGDGEPGPDPGASRPDPPERRTAGPWLIGPSTNSACRSCHGTRMMRCGRSSRSPGLGDLPINRPRLPINLRLVVRFSGKATGSDSAPPLGGTDGGDSEASIAQIDEAATVAATAGAGIDEVA